MSTDLQTLDAPIGSGDVDLQIRTARSYPRVVTDFLRQAEGLATLNEEVAASCFYKLPRQGKMIEGPSARLAEVVASCWGHMRIAARVVGETENFITARGEAWDVQRNVAISFEVMRRITDSKGKRYSDDMIAMTANAASSIALRNAVFKVVPSAFWRPIYLKALKVAGGDQKTLATRRADQLAYFAKLGADQARIFAALGVKSIEDITIEHMTTLLGIATAIREGDATLDSAFPAPEIKSPERIAAPAAETAQAAPVATPVATVEPQPTGLQAGADRVLSATKRHTKAGVAFWIVRTEREVGGATGCYATDPGIGAALETCVGSQIAVDLGVEKDTKGQWRIISVAPFEGLFS